MPWPIRPRGGRIDLSAGQSNAGLEICVSDSGCGIPAESIPRLFDRFYRVDQARSQQSGGFGLGLSIVRSIMLLHGGHVLIASEFRKRNEGHLVEPGDRVAWCGRRRSVLYVPSASNVLTVGLRDEQTSHVTQSWVLHRLPSPRSCSDYETIPPHLPWGTVR